jgi:hypothetical protein
VVRDPPGFHHYPPLPGESLEKVSGELFVHNRSRERIHGPQAHQGALPPWPVYPIALVIAVVAWKMAARERRSRG